MGEEETTQGEGGNQPAQTAICEGETGTVADSLCGGLQNTANQQRSEGSGSDAGERTRTTEKSGRCTQPKLGGTVDVRNPRSGLDSTANRVDRLRLLGNGVVPHTAAKAFSTQTGRLANHLG